jgi:hypothetical protein
MAAIFTETVWLLNCPITMKNFQISSSETDRKILRQSSIIFMVSTWLFLLGFWAWVLAKSRSDGWGVVVVEYMAVCLGLFAFFYIPLQLVTKRNGIWVAQIFANVECWLLIVPLVVASILCGVHIWHIWGTFTDGNDYFDPLVFILSYLTPLACLGIGGLFFLWRHGFVKKRSLVSAAILFVIPTVALCAFGVWFFHGQDQPWRLSHFVWWFVPFRVFGL